MSQGVKQLKVVDRDEPTPSIGFERVALFDADGAPWVPEAGDVPDAADVAVAAATGIVGTDVQAVLANLAGRVAALESA